MAVSMTNSTPQVRSSLDINPRPLSIRSLDYKRTLPADIVSRVRSEFVEMRGFSPTLAQAARLFDLSTDDCGRILGGLVTEGFLCCTSDGRYRRPI